MSICLMFTENADFQSQYRKHVDLPITGIFLGDENNLKEIGFRLAKEMDKS